VIGSPKLRVTTHRRHREIMHLEQCAKQCENDPMNAMNDDSPHGRIDARLAEILKAAPTTAPWYAQWKRLGQDTLAEERLLVYQAIRDSGLLPDDAGFFIVSWQLDEISAEDAASALRHLEDQMIAIEKKHGLGEGEAWSRGEAPAEYEEVRLEYQRAWDELYADRLEKHGESEMAALLRTDHDEFERRTEAGRKFFFSGPQLADATSLPKWLNSLFETVAESVVPQNTMGPMGLRYREDSGTWDIVVYPTSVELVGGAVDGEVVAPDFTLDLERLRTAFERIDDFGWRALGLPGTEGPHVWIEGTYREREVYLQLLAYAPDDEEPGMKVQASRSNHD
jgi:hypothetical protein